MMLGALRSVTVADVALMVNKMAESNRSALTLGDRYDL